VKRGQGTERTEGGQDEANYVASGQYGSSKSQTPTPTDRGDDIQGQPRADAAACGETVGERLCGTHAAFPAVTYASVAGSFYSLPTRRFLRGAVSVAYDREHVFFKPPFQLHVFFAHPKLQIFLSASPQALHLNYAFCDLLARIMTLASNLPR
jgi:hypothetical protein